MHNILNTIDGRGVSTEKGKNHVQIGDELIEIKESKRTLKMRLLEFLIGKDIVVFNAGVDNAHSVIYCRNEGQSLYVNGCKTIEFMILPTPGT